MINRLKVARKVTLVSIIGNILLSILKILLGLIGNSAAMVADGFHSVSDVVTSFVAYFGVKFSDAEMDEDHQYGHEKIELVVSKLLAIILFVTGIFIAYKAIIIIMNGEYSKPGMITVFAALLSIFTKEWMYRYTLKGALQINSNSLKVDAWHHRTDALSSVGALIGIVGSIYGIGVLDPIASILIAALVIKVAVDIYVDSVRGLIDTAASTEIINLIKETVNKIDGVIRIDLMKTRQHADKIYVDIEIVADGNLTLRESHQIAENVHDEVEECCEKIKHCMVHVNPE